MTTPTALMPGRRSRALKSLLHRCCVEVLEPRVLLTNVLQWHVDAGATGLNNTEVSLTPANVNSTTFGKIGTIALPSTDQLYAEPLYVSNLMITSGSNQGLHNVVILATESNNVYAYDTTTLARLWATNVGAPVTSNSGLVSQGYPNEVNFSGGRVGITGTPIISLANSGTTGYMYFDATILDNSQSNVPDKVSHSVFKMDISSGTVVAQTALGSAPGLTDPYVVGDTIDSVQVGAESRVYFAPGKELQRPGLTIVHNAATDTDNVYVAYGSYGDKPVYHGWIMGFDANTLALTSVYCDSPNTTFPANDTNSAGGAIWMSAASITTDGTNLFVTAGNGESNVAIGDYSDSVIKLTPDATTSANPGVDGYGLHVTDFFRPYNQVDLTDTDWDLGSGGTVLLPDNEIAMISKQGVLYVMNRSNMGGWTGGSPPDNVVQEVSLDGHHGMSTPVFFNNTLYLLNSFDVGKAYSFDPNTGLLSTTPTLVSNVGRFDSYGANAQISANGTANGIVWGVLFSSSQQTLYAYDASTMTMIYNSSINSADLMGGGPRFITPTIADGKVFVGSNSNLYIYGNKIPNAVAPNAPTSFALSSTTGSMIYLQWNQSGVTNETSFLVERSVNDNSNFVQIASLPIDSTTFTDTNVTVGTTYFYRVRASNASTSAYTTVLSGVPQSLTSVGNLYHFDGGTGVLDSGFSPNSGTFSGTTTPSYVSPGFDGTGSALFFNGVASDNTATQTGAGFNTQFSVNGWLAGTNVGVNGVTMTAWIKTSEMGNDNPLLAPALVGIYQTNSQNSPYFADLADSQDGWNDFRYGYIDGEGHIGISFDGDTRYPHAGDRYNLVSNIVVSDGQWHSVGFTRNAINGLMQLWVDGVYQGSFYGNTGSKSAATSTWGVQVQKSSSGATVGHAYFVGELDELHVYPEILSSSEIVQLGVAAPTPSGLNATPVSATSVQVSWNAVSATGIDIYRRAGTSGSFTPLAAIQGNFTSFTDTGLTTGTQYFYEIRAGDPIGTSSFTGAVSAIVAAPQILARSTFYNNSAYDGSSAANNTLDDGAIALDKTALLPNATASFVNYTSYSKGLNGILVDFSGTANGFSAADITLKKGNDNDPAAWTLITDATINIRTIPGGGGTRVDITIPDGEVVNAWVQVTISNAHTQLAHSDQFYFGNAPGETGNSPTNAQVSAIDELGARYNPVDMSTASTAAAIVNIYDFNRDKVVDGADVLVVGPQYTTFLNALNLISTPAGPAALPSDQQSDGTPGATVAPAPPTNSPSGGTSDPSPPAGDGTSGADPVLVHVPERGKKKSGGHGPAPAAFHVPQVTPVKPSSMKRLLELVAARFRR